MGLSIWKFPMSNITSSTILNNLGTCYICRSLKEGWKVSYNSIILTESNISDIEKFQSFE